jgi:hypothetical protein
MDRFHEKHRQESSVFTPNSLGVPVVFPENILKPILGSDGLEMGVYENWICMDIPHLWLKEKMRINRINLILGYPIFRKYIQVLNINIYVSENYGKITVKQENPRFL